MCTLYNSGQKNWGSEIYPCLHNNNPDIGFLITTKRVTNIYF